jgi:trimeric autotransporter adhesin
MSECKRSSTCRCPDCAAAMSAFTVADLKAVSGITDEHTTGPVQRDPPAAKQQTAVAAQTTAPASPITPITELSAELTAADKLDTMAEEQEADESSLLRGTFDDNSAILAAPDSPRSDALGTPRKQLGSGPILSPSLDEFHDSFSDEQAVAAKQRAATPAAAAAAQHDSDAMDMTLRQDEEEDAGADSVPAAALITADADEALQEPALPEPATSAVAAGTVTAAAAVEDAAKAAPGGRRRRRVSAGLGMMDQYASSDSTPKYSQGELDAAVHARIAELTAAHEKAAADSAQQHSAEAAALREELQTASQKIAALARAQQDKACDEELMATFEAKVEWYEKQKTEQDAVCNTPL